MAADPLTLWQTAVRLVKMYTSVASVYVANIVDDEQPDYAAPEGPEADIETDDEAEHAAGTLLWGILQENRCGNSSSTTLHQDIIPPYSNFSRSLGHGGLLYPCYAV